LNRGARLDEKRTDGARPIQLTNGDYHYRGWRDVPKDHPATPRAVLDHLRARGAACDLCTAAHIGDQAGSTRRGNELTSRIGNRQGVCR